MRYLLGKLRLRVGFCEACDVYHFTSFQLSEPRREQDQKSRILATRFSGIRDRSVAPRTRSFREANDTERKYGRWPLCANRDHSIRCRAIVRKPLAADLNRPGDLPVEIDDDTRSRPISVEATWLLLFHPLWVMGTSHSANLLKPISTRKLSPRCVGFASTPTS